MRGAATNRFIDPHVLSSITNLQLIAKTVVEGFLSGLHRSPYHGFSLDFAEYREYAPGDDLRRVDWKVYGRTDRYYVKKYEGDTNTLLYLMIDVSKSMGFTSHALTKLDYARYLAASLAYLAMRQKDAVGLVSFDSDVITHVPARSRSGYFFTLLHELEGLQLGGQTDISGAVENFAHLIRKKAMVVLLSDFYQEVEQIRKTLRFFHHRGNDVVIFHLLDPVELNMPFDQIATLEDMETMEYVPYSPQYSRAAYLDLLREHIQSLKRECRNIHIDYELLNTEKPLDWALYRYLALREKEY